MSDDANTLTPEPQTSPANEAASVGSEPAFLTRARRILAGTIHPDDYLPVTPEVQAAVDRDMAFVREHIKNAAVSGRIREVYEPDPAVPIRQRNDWLLSFHHGGQNIACIENDTGVIVLAVGLEQTGALLNAIPYELRKDVGFDTPDTFLF
jgi:hypothetical protein